MAGLPTDEALFGEIYKRYLRAFSDFSDDDKTRSTKIWTPINIDALAKHFRCDPDLIFGRLYYHSNARYGSTNSSGDKTDFFAIRVGQDRHCVNFPLLASVLADLRDDRKRFVVSTRLAGLSLLVSTASILIALLARAG